MPVSNDVSKYDPAMAVREVDKNGVVWYGIEHPAFRLSGLAFHKAGEKIRRLPDDPELPEAVRYLSNNTSGVRLDFKCTSRQIRVRVKLSHVTHADHMAQTCSCGFDLYCGAPGKSFLAGVTRFKFDADEYESALMTIPFQNNKMRDFTLNFPLYSGVDSVEIGVDEGTELALPEPWSETSPLVVYGSSITQGGCASRPGMSYTAILSRALNRPVLNFGFSGSGKGEAAVAEYLASITDAGLFLLDYEPNAMPEGIKATLKNFLDILRRKHKYTPIAVVSCLRFNQELAFTEDTAIQKSELSESAKFQQREVRRRNRAGDRNIYFINGSGLCGKNWHEFSVDGCHQTDLGFFVIAEKLLPKIKRMLNK